MFHSVSSDRSLYGEFDYGHLPQVRKHAAETQRNQLKRSNYHKLRRLQTFLASSSHLLLLKHNNELLPDRLPTDVHDPGWSAQLPRTASVNHRLPLHLHRHFHSS